MHLPTSSRFKSRNSATYLKYLKRTVINFYKKIYIKSLVLTVRSQFFLCSILFHSEPFLGANSSLTKFKWAKYWRNSKIKNKITDILTKGYITMNSHPPVYWAKKVERSPSTIDPTSLTDWQVGGPTNNFNFKYRG